MPGAILMPAPGVSGERIAILVIDVTRGSVEDRWNGDPQVKALLDPIARLLAAARSKGMPVFYTHGGLFSQTAKAARITPVERGSWAYRVPLNNDRGTTYEELEESMRIPPQIAPLAGEVVIRKIKPSGFFETPLHSFLTLHRIDTVIVCGTATHSGVLYTVADAFAYNYRVIVPRECAATRQPEFQEVSFKLMGLTHANIAFLDDVLQDINNRPTQESVLRAGRAGGTYSQRAGFGERPAVLVIDVHRGATDERSTTQGALQAIVPRIAELLAAARLKQVPVLYTTGGLMNLTTRAAPVTDTERGSWLFKNGLNDAWGTTPQEVRQASQFPTSIAPGPGEPVIHKYKPSGFYESPLRSFLAWYNVDTLVVCGSATNSGILFTVNDAFSANYRVIVPRECVATRNPEYHEISLEMIDRTRGDVLALRDVLTYFNNLPPQRQT